MLHNAKIRSFDVDAMIAARKKNIKVMVGAHQTVTEEFHTITKRQLEVAQTMVQGIGARLTDLMGDMTPEERMGKQAELVKSGIEQASQSMC